MRSEFPYRLQRSNGPDVRTIALFHDEETAKAFAFALNVFGDIHETDYEFHVDDKG